MHSLIQQFARESLAEAGEAPDAQAAHAHLFQAYAIDADKRFGAPDATAKRVAGDDMRAASADIRAALEWFYVEDVSAALRLAHTMYGYWMQSGRITEARAAFEMILARLPGEATQDRARALNRLGVLAMFVGDYAAALRELERARQAYLELGDLPSALRPLGNMAIAARYTGDYARAIALSLEVLTQLGAEVRDPEDAVEFASAANANLVLAVAYSLSDQFETALIRLDRAMTMLKRVPDPYHYETEHATVGYVLLNQRDYSGARKAYLRCLEYSLAHDARAVLVGCLSGLAGVAAETGAPERAALLFGASQRTREQLGLPLPSAHPVYHRTVAAARAALGEAEFQRNWDAGQRLSDAEAARAAAL